jgi:hypothetical protein
VTRFLMRVGADDDAVALHRALLRAGKPSPLDDVQADGVGALSGVGAVAHARKSLRRFS